MTRHFWQFVFCVVIGFGGAVAAMVEMQIGGWVLIILALAWCVGVIVDSIWERHVDEIESRGRLVSKRTAFAVTIAATDNETRHFLAHEWPEMGVEFGEEALTYILRDGVNTQVLVPFLRAFLVDSTEQAFVDMRNYNDVKYLQERFDVSRDIVRMQWNKATDLLLEEGYLIAGTMAGNQTYKWTSAEHFKKLRRRWLNVRTLPTLEG